MGRAEVIARLKAAEPALRARGVGSLYIFGSFSRDEAEANSDLDVFVDPANDDFYSLDNYMGAYEDLRAVFPGRVGYSTREGLSKHIRSDIERDALRIF